MRHAVFAAAELAPGEKRAVELDRRRILVVRSEVGDYHAVADSCPHQGARLSDGVLSGEFSSSGPGEHRLTRLGEVVRCPWHNFAFDVTTGRCLLDPERYRVKVYPVAIDGGQVMVEV